MEDIFIRNKALFGEKACEKLKNSHVLVFGVGGVGGAAAEGLCRAGIGKLTLVDPDKFDSSNLNRQIFSDSENVGKDKVLEAKARLMKINPEISVFPLKVFWEKGGDESIFEGVDFVVDAIDTVPSKLDIIRICSEKNIPVISSMGTGNKICPEMLKVSDINKTSVCPLARKMRIELRKMGIKKLKVVYSEEIPKKAYITDKEGRSVPASSSFVPPVAGYITAGEVIKEIIKDVYTGN